MSTENPSTPSWHLRASNETLRYTKFEISMIYGFVIDEPSEDTFEKICQGEDSTLQTGWSATYDPNSYANRTVHIDLGVNGDSDAAMSWKPKVVQISHPREGHEADDRWPSAVEKVSERIKRRVTLRRDGAGTLTLTFPFKAKSLDPSHLFTTADLLEVMMLLPRQSNDAAAFITESTLLDAPEAGRTERHPADLNRYFLDLKRSNDTVRVGDKFSKFSLPFQLFSASMAYLSTTYGLEDWREIGIGEKHQVNGHAGHWMNGSGKSMDSAPPMYDLSHNSLTDPQIPYIHVHAAVPFNQYQGAFLDGDTSEPGISPVRKTFTKEIAAVLGRWLNEHNIRFCSTDYWASQGVLDQGAFKNQYMNSLVFVTMSGLATVSLYPDIDETELAENDYDRSRMREPISITRDSILRCLEFSRMRWHHAIWINRELDWLVKRLSEAKTGTQDFLPFFKRHFQLQESSALHFEDPNTYLWDASVGAHLASFLHQQVIENIESEITDKLRHVSDLLENNLETVKTQDYIKHLNL